MISLTCRNHPDLRWSTKGAGHSLFFVGSASSDKPAMSITLFKMFDSRVKGVNPFSPDLKSPDGPVTTWSGIVETFEAVKRMEDFYVFECECPASDLVRVEEDGEIDYNWKGGN